MLAKKIVNLNAYKNELYNDIILFIERKGIKSKNTASSYLTDIKDFFRIIKNKEIEELDIHDLKIRFEDFENYILELDDMGLMGSTINRKVATMISFLKYLSGFSNYKNIIDTSYFKNIDKLPDNSRGYDVLTKEEIEQMANLAKKEREKGLIKYYLILFSADTCIRQSAILKLKWSDFKDMGHEVEITGVDKGNKYFKSKISKNFYNELLQLKNEKNDYVFDISKRTISRMMERLKKKMDFGSRYITFHSFRKSGITFIWNLTKDPLAVMNAGNHSSFDTTKIYIQEDNYGAIGMFSSSNIINLDIFKNMTREELLNLIYNARKDIQITLALKAKEMQINI